MDIVEIWQTLEKNATKIMIFLAHYIWAENNEYFDIFIGMIFRSFLLVALWRQFDGAGLS